MFKKSRRLDIFPKRLTHGFGQNIAIFPTFFLGTVDDENIFYDILKRRNAFLGSKNKKFKSRKIDIFPKGKPMVLAQKCQKYPFFQLFFF